jgi:predicted site-specific integrase-resolvase
MDVWTLNGVEFTTIKEFAEEIGVSRQTIYTWTAKGMPILRSKKSMFLVPIEDALKWIKQYRR